jgi:DNA-binding transcriptional LysR family regulator
MTSMPMEALKVFCDLADLRSFSKTAEANGISQPTVSRHLRQLEDRLGGPLIDRSRRPLRLTPLGQAYYDGCKTLLDRYAELESSLIRDHARMSVTVRVAAIYSAGLSDMSHYVERCEARHPYAHIQLDYLHPDHVYRRVLDGTADLGLVSFPTTSRELTVLPWREEEMVVVCKPDHPLAQGARVRPAQLNGEKYIAFDRGLVIRREVDRFLRDHGAAVEIALEFDNIENIKKGIEIGAGVALLPLPTIRQEQQTGTLRCLPLEGGRMVRPLGIIHRRHHQLCSAALGFIEVLHSGETAPNEGSLLHRNGEDKENPARESGRHIADRTSQGANGAPDKRMGT